MLRIKRARITHQLRIARSAVTNSMDHEEIASLLEKQGFSRTKLNQGTMLYEVASILVGDEIIAEEEVQALEERIHGSQKVIADHYLVFVQAAKKCFGRNSLSLLGLSQRLPRSSRSCCEKAKATFMKVNDHPELVKHLAGSGFDATHIKSACDLIESCDEDVKKLNDARSALARAANEREQAFVELRRWLSAFCEAGKSILVSNPDFLETFQGCAQFRGENHG